LNSAKILSTVKYVFFLSIGVGLLWYVTKDQDYELFIKEFKTASYSWIALAMFCGGLSHVSRALRWQMLIKSMGHKTKFSTTFYAVMIGYFANLLVPRLGEVSKCAVLHKNEKIPFNSLLGTVIAERIFDFICLLFITFLVIFFQFEFLKNFIYTYVYGPLTDKLNNNYILLIILFALMIIGSVVFFFLTKKIYKKNKEKPSAQKFKGLVLGFAQGIKTIKHTDNKLLFIGHSIFIWGMYFMMTYFCFFSLQATSSLSVADGFTVLVIGSLGIVAPVPGGIGAYHFMVIATLVELFGINNMSATSFAYISHTSQTLLIVLLGLFSFLAIFLRNKQIKNEQKQTD